MFLAWNEIKRNKLKFGLIIGILVLISYLLFLLSGLANGLINMNTEGIKKWKANAIVLNKDANQTVQQSVLKISDVEDKFKEETPLKQMGIIASNGDIEENALLFGVTSNSFLIPKIEEGKTFDKDNDVIIDQSFKDKGFKVGDTIHLSQSDEKLHIVGVSESAKYNASPVIFVRNKMMEKINPALSLDKTNAVIVKDSKWKDKKVDGDLEIIGIDDFVENLPGYKPQNLTMNFMITFLFVISATVIGVFLYVITLQKKNLFGVLKAQGFTNGFLMKMVLAQTFILSLIGTLTGLILTLLTSLVLPKAVPVQFSIGTLAIFGIVLILTSLVGSLFSVLSIRKIDPLKAIG